MRLVLVNPVLAEGGAGRVMIHMANHWAEHGHEVKLLCFEDGSVSPGYRLSQRVELEYLRLDKHSPHVFASIVNNVARLGKIRHAVQDFAPDAVVSFIDIGNVRTIVALLGAGIPLVVSERVHPGHFDIGNSWRVLRRLAYPLADAVVVQTGDIAEYCKGWRLKRLEVIANPVVLPLATGEAPVIDGHCVLAMGRLAEQKCFALLINAFAEASRDHDDWTLCIAGQGPLRGLLESQIQGLGLAGRVRLLGQQADVGGLLRQAEVFVLSSAFEGFPNALSEAMAAGVACIATDCPSGPAELIDHGENGWLVPNGDESALARALSELMSNADLRDLLGRRARDIVEAYATADIMSRWDRLLDDLIRYR